MSILKDFSYKNTSFTKNAYMTYHEKLKNEIEKIPKLKKKFFLESLAKHKFDSDVYIPQSNEKNRKIYPNKDYLLNKIVLFDNKVNKQKKKIDAISKDFTNFYKFYNFLQSTNTKQRDYISNLVTIYKEKNKNNSIEDIEYKNDENIFSNSILLDCNDAGGGNDDNEFRKYRNPDGEILLNNDRKILINFDRAIHHKRSPNSMANKEKNYNENFITSINQSYYINKNKKAENNGNAQLNNNNKTETNLGNKDETYSEKKLKEEDKNKLKISNKKEKSNTLDKYIINSRLLKINKISRNKINNDFSSNKDSTNNFTYHDKNNILNKTEKNKYDPLKLSNIRNNKTNIKSIRTTNVGSNQKKSKFFSSKDNKNSKYLLTTLNKINMSDKIDDLSEINNDKKILTPENEKNENKNDIKKDINKSAQKGNLKTNLPSIGVHKENLSKSINYTKINEEKSNNKIKTKKTQNKKILIKKEISNSNYNFKKSKERDINILYSTIATNSNYFRGYPALKIKNYFKKYKNMNIKKVELEKGSNLVPILDNIENIVKNKDIPKLVKSLDETKKYLFMKKKKTEKLELDEDKTLSFLDKINENEKLFPLIKYDCAEKIIFGEKNLKNI